MLRKADGDYRLEEVELAAPGSGEVLVRVVGAGMCHTDVLPRSPASFSPPPIITGHEGSGVVEALGPGVDGKARIDTQGTQGAAQRFHIRMDRRSHILDGRREPDLRARPPRGQI